MPGERERERERERGGEGERQYPYTARFKVFLTLLSPEIMRTLIKDKPIKILAFPHTLL